MENARRWSGYVCPDCRFVFRVPRDHDGKGIVCPSCRRLLKIPAADDTPPPLVARLRQGPAVQPVVAAVQPLKKRRRGKKAGEDHSWEHRENRRRSGRGEKRQMSLMLMGGATLFALILAWVFIAMNSGQQAVVISDPEVEPVAPAAVAEAGEATRTARGDKEFLAEAEPMAEVFLNAGTVEEIIPLVRDPAVAEVRIRSFYADGKVEAPGISAFNIGGNVLTLGKVATVMIRTRDHENRNLAFIDTPDGLKIDWESWVGWSEMPWEKFLSSKPGTAHLFRVNLSSVDYYNFEFEDESKWQSYRLESPDMEHAIYGYAPKGSVLNAKLRPEGESKREALMLNLKFPADSSSSTQVEIESVVGQGWVEGADDP